MFVNCVQSWVTQANKVLLSPRRVYPKAVSQWRKKLYELRKKALRDEKKRRKSAKRGLLATFPLCDSAMFIYSLWISVVICNSGGIYIWNLKAGHPHLVPAVQRLIAVSLFTVSRADSVTQNNPWVNPNQAADYLHQCSYFPEAVEDDPTLILVIFVLIPHMCSEGPPSFLSHFSCRVRVRLRDPLQIGCWSNFFRGWGTR